MSDIFEFIDNVKDLSKQKNPGIPKTKPDSPYLGKYVCWTPTDPVGIEVAVPQQVELNFTGPPGTASGVYYSLLFQMIRWSFNIVKVDEWIEVSPTRADYYQATIASKEALATTIKQGLASAAAAIGDYELAKHDLRKYREILNYFEAAEKAKKIGDKKKREDTIRKAEHSLRAMYVDQVDIHTGEGVSLRSIVSRWSTIIADFMRLTDEMDSVEAIRKELSISGAEAVVLKTKNQLYREWKDLFSQAAKDRYDTLLSMVESRKKSIEEYKEWVKPYIARFKTLKVGSERETVRKRMMRSFADITGQSTFANKIIVWAWRPFKTIEPRRPGTEGHRKMNDFVVDPYDDLVRNHFVLDKKVGLASIYPWLAEKLSEEKAKKLEIVEKRRIKVGEATKADEIAEKIKSKWKKYDMKLDPTELYYALFTIEVDRLGVRLQSGELEDITFLVKSNLITQNLMLVKLIELECRDLELEKNIEQMMGTTVGEKGIEETMRKDYPSIFPKPQPEEKSEWKKFKEELEKELSEIGEVFEKISRAEAPGWLLKPGHYEKSMSDRMSKHYFKPMGSMFGDITNFLKAKFGVE